MKDFQAKGTGNSRFLKSAISPTTTWEQFRDLLRGGTAPIDLNGINPLGVDEVGTPLSKANLLTDDTATTLGLISSNNPTVNDALGTIKTLLDKKFQYEESAYLGTGTFGKDHLNSLTFPFAVKALMICATGATSGNIDSVTCVMPFPKAGGSATVGNTTSITYDPAVLVQYFASADGKTIYWYNAQTAGYQMNVTGKTFRYIALGW